MVAQVRVLTLEEEENYEQQLFHVKKGWSIRFSLGSSLCHRNVEFFCNYPFAENEKFVRNEYNLFKWAKSDSHSLNFQETYVDIKITRAGAYQFYLAVNNGDVRHTCCTGAFLVDPTLATADGELPLDRVMMQSVLCKLLGPFNQWKKQLSIGPESGYNMFHFSPIQELGESNSSYSIRAHHAVNPKFSTDKQEFNVEMMQNFVEKIHSSWGMFSIVDVVWNHCSNDAQWLKKHPLAGYNLVNSPHMRPAFLVDRALWYLNKDIMANKYVKKGVPTEITKESELKSLRTLIREAVDEVKLYDFFALEVSRVQDEFKNMFMASGFPLKKMEDITDEDTWDNLKIVQSNEWKRYGCTVDLPLAVRASTRLCSKTQSVEFNMAKCCERLREELLKLNAAAKKQTEELCEKIADNIIGHVKYHFVDSDGPQWGKVTEFHSISVRYFSYPFEDASLKADIERMAVDVDAKSIMAHNGWVMGFDAQKNFAESDSMVYLNRELVAWGDCIKLRYGEKPQDSPFLWDYMRNYTQQMARSFHGFRIDNCHSTPMHVAEFLLDSAREVRPDLYVVAELFTNNEATDNMFINRLGINSLIRENLGASSSGDLGRHVHRYGGQPVGSFVQPSVQDLLPSMSHAIFMDMTHDNKSLFEARSVFDHLPSSALVAATSCATGSTRGYDELVPHHIDVVQEERLFQPNGVVSIDYGIVRAKESLNHLHSLLNEQGFSEIYVDQVTDNVCCVTRHSPSTHEKVIVVAHSVFSRPDESSYPSVANAQKAHRHVPSIKIEGVVKEVVLEARLLEKDSSYVFKKDAKLINGNENYKLEMQEDVKIDQSKFCKLSYDGSEIEFVDFIPGSVIAFKVALQPDMKKSVSSLRNVLATFPSLNFSHKSSPSDDNMFEVESFFDIVSDLSLIDLNRVLYRCHEEEEKEGWGGGVYEIPGFGKFVYCGLQGIMSILSCIRHDDDLGHPFCDNLRQGNWVMDYTCNRLKHSDGTHRLADWFETVFSWVGQLPRYLVPSYFEAVVTCVYTECLNRAFSLMSKSVQDGSSFFKHLSLTSLQMLGDGVDKLPAVVCADESVVEPHVSMAAGLPHFSVGYMRCWGRDTFIAMRGLLLITGRFEEARTIILAYAACLRHGLIPNLLGAGPGSRYNSRDATWFWMQAVQDYCKMSPEGNAFLKAPVIRMYPSDNTGAEFNQAPPYGIKIQDICQEILMRHFQGVSFRERNAGVDLDRDMSTDGFNQSIGVDFDTGFVYGGSEHNCGTWMDKMGSSKISGNQGHPATSRDGSAVEIVGLCKSALHWLVDMHDNGHYLFSEVVRKDEQGKNHVWTYKEWNHRIKNNFENKFFVQPSCTDEGVNKKEIYKDTFKAAKQFTDFQLRPNFPIAMCVAPELFDTDHALKALEQIEKHLLGPIGVATLDPADWNYDGIYENGLDSDVYKKARGFNYHQGPEWTWVLGPFLRAKLYFSQLGQSEADFEQTVRRTQRTLLPHYHMLVKSPWRGIPELTNKDGIHCNDSCPTQAWSTACLLEVLQYIRQASNVA